MATNDEWLSWQRKQVPWWRRGQHDKPTVRHPAPNTPGGLPAGWTLLTCTTASDTATWGLCRRDAGGWLLVRHIPSTAETTVNAARESLGDMFKVVHTTNLSIPVVWTVSDELVDWLQSFIVNAYDPTDPDEAAERVLFALSGTLRRPPKALT